jgi:putative inorganic carbon (hco3(-)) transporter
MNEPNRFAQILIVLLPLALFQARFGRSRSGRLLGWGAGLLILAGVLLTYSRGAFLTLAVLVALLAVLGFVRPSRVVFSVLVMLIAVPVVAPGYYDRIGSITEALDVFDPAQRTGAEPVARGRTTETLAALYAFLDHPVLGVGPGHYLPHYSVRYQLDPDIGLRYLPEPRRAHNLFAEMAAETGLAGLLVFVSIPFVLLRGLWRRRQELIEDRPDLAFLATAFGLGILAYLGTGVFLHLAFERYLWLFLALSGAAVRILADHVPLHSPGAVTRP